MKPVRTIPARLREVAKEKLLTKITKLENGCWIFGGSTDRNGYTELRPFPLANYKMPAHRIAYEAFKGDIPESYTIDHLCRRRNCVNPDHLEAVPHRENLMRSPNQPAAVNARKTHCIRGHELTPENTYEQPRGRGCLECRRMRARGELGPVARLRAQDRLRA